MSAGQPDWNRLHREGKLPKEQRNKIGLLPELDAAHAALEKFEQGACDECRAKFFPAGAEAKAAGVGAAEAPKELAPVEEKKEEKKPEPAASFDAKCAHEGCDYVAHGKSEAIANNTLRLHARSHEVKA